MKASVTVDYFGCRATGATALVKLGAPSADELGFAKSLKIAEIGGTHVIVLEQVRIGTRCTQGRKHWRLK